MDDDFSIFDKGQKLLGNMFKERFVLQKFIADAVYFDGVFMDIALRIEVTMKGVASQFSVQQFHTTDFNDSVPGLG